MRHRNTFPAPRRQPALPDKATAARNQGPAAPNPVRPPLNSAASADETPPETGTLNGLLCAHKTVLGSEEKQHPLSLKPPKITKSQQTRQSSSPCTLLQVQTVLAQDSAPLQARCELDAVPELSVGTTGWGKGTETRLTWDGGDR